MSEIRVAVVSVDRICRILDLWFVLRVFVVGVSYLSAILLFSSLYHILFFFFFSSRRRHTRWTGDWSSDVCSSDFTEVFPNRVLSREKLLCERIVNDHHRRSFRSVGELKESAGQERNSQGAEVIRRRSEERRVGKECRARWWRYH